MNMEILHYGIKRRSGRYPYGSGERPYQSDIKRSIDEGTQKARKDKYRNTKRPSKDAISFKMHYTIDNQGYKEAANRLSKLSKGIDSDVEDIKRSIKKEITSATKNPSFKTDVDQKIYNTSKGKELSENEFYHLLFNSMFEVVNTPKYMPETAKKNLELQRSIDKYHDSLIDEVDRLIDSEIGSRKIPKAQSGTTYNDVLETLLSSDTEKHWNYRLRENLGLEIQEYHLDDSFYSLEEYKLNHRM